MSTQKRTWRENFWIRLRHIWWFYAAMGAIMLLLTTKKHGLLAFSLMNLTFFFYLLHLAWLQGKGVDCEPNRALGWFIAVVSIPFALLAGLTGYGCIGLYFGL